ncbi:hypothetical protein [Polymorphospora rubra]|uniref:Uncharacterized protein n=1 Tax=Polymorphospora rubra TaxID=338584 RepID=A0A810MXF1_9ACTN|nr:hypothetical protein [Polymorphospora rubra]BCJ64283.1 hypothetical protein Prubr_13040 [Polymorphospora rubra]
MRLRVVYDEDGRIVAAAAVPERGDDSVLVTPLAGPRQVEAEVDVPDEMADVGLDVICTRMRVDPANGRLTSAEAGR